MTKLHCFILPLFALATIATATPKVLNVTGVDANGVVHTICRDLLVDVPAPSVKPAMAAPSIPDLGVTVTATLGDDGSVHVAYSGRWKSEGGDTAVQEYKSVIPDGRTITVPFLQGEYRSVRFIVTPSSR